MDSVAEKLAAKRHLVHGIAWRFARGQPSIELDDACQVAMLAAWKVLTDDEHKHYRDVDGLLAVACKSALIDELRSGKPTGVKRKAYHAGARRPVSLNRSISGDEDGELLDLIADDAGELAHEAVLDDAQRTHEAAAVHRALARLPERYRLAVYLHFFEDLTLVAVGEVLGVTDTRVSQMLTEARKKMRPTVHYARA